MSFERVYNYNKKTLALYRRALRISQLFKDPQIGKRFALNAKDAIRLYSKPNSIHSSNQWGSNIQEAIDNLIKEGNKSLDTYEKILKWDLEQKDHSLTPLVYFKNKF